jgi:hypothetical protein
MAYQKPKITIDRSVIVARYISSIIASLVAQNKELTLTVRVIPATFNSTVDDDDKSDGDCS